MAQNRLREKTLASDLGISTPAFWAVRSADDLAAALSALSGKGVLKTTEQGYDGKGQMRIAKGDDTGTIWAEMNTSEAILETFIDFPLKSASWSGGVRTAGQAPSRRP